MANIESVKKSIAAQADLRPAENTLEGLLDRETIKKRFERVLGAKAAGFMSSILSLANTNTQLKAVDPKSIVASAAIAASLDLPINASLGYAYIIPYGDKAQFQIGAKGFIQLAIRTALYKTMNTSDVYADELESWNPITGELKFKPMDQWKMRDAGTATPCGYAAYFQLMNGFEKSLYMSVDQVTRHAKRYSKSYENPNGNWKKNFPSMALKTVIKLLLTKYGIMSIEMRTAFQADQAIVHDNEKGPVFEYKDGSNDAIDAETIDTTNKEPEIEFGNPKV